MKLLVKECRLDVTKQGAGELEALLTLLAPKDMDREEAKLSEDRSCDSPRMPPISPSPDDPETIQSHSILIKSHSIPFNAI